MSTRKTIHAATFASIELQGQTRDTPAVKSWRCGCDRVTEGWWLCGYHEGYEDALDALTGVIDAWRAPESPGWTANVIEALRHCPIVTAAEESQ